MNRDSTGDQLTVIRVIRVIMGSEAVCIQGISVGERER